MFASFKQLAFCNVTYSLCRIPLRSGTKPFSTHNSLQQQDDSCIKGRNEWVVVAEDGNIVCWHPEKTFPYECTKPIPAAKADEMADSYLKVQCKEDLNLLQKPLPEHFLRQKLMDLTYTTKHVWFPRPQRKYRKKHPVRDREGL